MAEVAAETDRAPGHAKKIASPSSATRHLAAMPRAEGATTVDDVALSAAGDSGSFRPG